MRKKICEEGGGGGGSANNQQQLGFKPHRQVPCSRCCSCCSFALFGLLLVPLRSDLTLSFCLAFWIQRRRNLETKDTARQEFSSLQVDTLLNQLPPGRCRSWSLRTPSSHTPQSCLRTRRSRRKCAICDLFRHTTAALAVLRLAFGEFSPLGLMHGRKGTEVTNIVLNVVRRKKRRKDIQRPSAERCNRHLGSLCFCLE